MKNPLKILELLNDNKQYAIPLYQRNFAWTDLEISQLIIDILDAIKDNKEDYFIGSLVICKKENKYDIIDGQQRFTAILLISMAIQNKFNGTKRINGLNLSFRARQSSNDTLLALLRNNTKIYDNKNENEILDGYNDVVSALREYVDKDEYKGINFEEFYGYLLNNVKIFINEMPEKTDVNLYFERFNTRGEQLESHEIIKAELMQRLYDETEDTIIIQKFAKIWEACSEFETPCIKFFKKKIRGSDNDNEREKIFKCEWQEYEPGKNSWRYNYDLDDALYSHVIENNENKGGLLDEFTEQESGEADELNRYRCIINFNTFLYYVLYITDNVSVESIQLDDKKLKDAFRISTRDSAWILKFGRNLLKCKFLFDNFIIRQSQETTDKLKEGQWFLHKAYREDKNEKRRGLLYVQTRFDKNSFSYNNDEIIMLQSMFAVTFSAYKDTKWLYATMKHLFDNAGSLNQHDSGGSFYSFLENLAKQRYVEMLGGNVDMAKLRYTNGVPIYAFNLTDYVLWKNRGNVKLKKEYPNIKFDEFSFTYRRSIEHWYPQNPNESEKKARMSDDLLHSFGNLCLIVASQNSQFGNLDPGAKLANWRNYFPTQSLKLQMMAQKTRDNGSWEQKDIKIINDFENYILSFLSDFIK